MGTLTAFLAAMDGMERPRGFINIVRKMIGMSVLSPPEYRYFMVGATNRADALDPALTRAGRFGRQIHVGFPDLEGRIITFRGYLKKVDHNLSDANIETIARDMDKGTGAKVKDAVNEALLLGFRDGRPRTFCGR
jgi:ATP-dependent 26S proteasome regulatory subunit